jgi:hypothetical protein
VNDKQNDCHSERRQGSKAAQLIQREREPCNESFPSCGRNSSHLGLTIAPQTSKLRVACCWTAPSHSHMTVTTSREEQNQKVGTSNKTTLQRDRRDYEAHHYQKPRGFQPANGRGREISKVLDGDEVWMVSLVHVDCVACPESKVSTPPSSPPRKD